MFKSQPLIIDAVYIMPDLKYLYVFANKITNKIPTPIGKMDPNA